MSAQPPSRSLTVTATLNGVPVPVELDEHALAEIAKTINPTPDQSPWLTVERAADYLGITVHAIRKLYEHRHIPKHQPGGTGGRIFLHRNDLDTYMLDGREKP